MEQQPPNDQLNPQVWCYPKVCDVCKEKNLTEKIHLINCLRCGEPTCIHLCSAIDPANCHECLQDVQITDQTIYKETEHYDEETDKVIVKRQKARQIQFSGLDWLFFQKKIREYTSDEELSIGIEYHHAQYQAMMYEREKRRVDYFHRNAGKKVQVHTTNGVVSTSETTVKKTKTIRPETKTKAEANVKALIETLLKGGKTPAEIMKMMGVK